MTTQSYRHVIVGAGLAGASAAQAIRERDHSGSILLIGAEHHFPYDRPPLSKKLWTGAKTVAQIRLHEENFYAQEGIELCLGHRVLGIDVRQRTLLDSQGRRIRFERLLLATGGAPRHLPIPGEDLEGVCYFRTLDDYLNLREKAAPGRSAVVIGGGFIGSEIAAALTMSQVDVTMIFPSSTLCARVLPDSLGRAVQRVYQERGVNVLSNDEPIAIESVRGRLRTLTRAGHEIDADMVAIGVGIAPQTALARAAGLTLRDGVVVDKFLETSRPGIYAAGDLAAFPCLALGRRVRMEHWDNARAQGLRAGDNMAGGRQAYDYLPYFFSDLFDFGYEAVGDVDSSLQTRYEWQEENRKGLVYYLKDGRVRGALMCNVWGKVDAARELIMDGEKVGARP
jgi:NADPH-dependent 2,4-dienoyl-CoA reductase/sulfur reductase-like enzyme